MGVAEGVVVCIAVLVGSGVMRVVVGDGAGVVDGTARRKLSRRACCGPRRGGGRRRRGARRGGHSCSAAWCC